MVLLGVLAASASAARASAASAGAGAAEPALRAERLRGEVLLLRGGSPQRVTSETVLRKGDVLRTGKEGSIRVVTPFARTDVAPFSTVRLDDPALLSLRYGHVRAVALHASGKRASAGKPTFRIKTPTAVLGVRGTEFLVHVTRDEKEFSERLAGHLADPPALTELPKLASFPLLYSQVCCIDGNVEVKPSKSDMLVLSPGDIARIRASSGEFAPTAVGLDEVRATRQALGFPND